jgi:hypothetical protein
MTIGEDDGFREEFNPSYRLRDLSVAGNAGFPAHEIGAIIRHLSVCPKSS